MNRALPAGTRTFLALAIAFIACLFAVSPTALARQTYTYRSRNYEIVTDLDRREIRDIANHMDAVADEYLRRFSSFAVRNSMPNKLYVLKHRKDYIALLDQIDFSAENTGGAFFARNGESGLATWTNARPRARMYHVLQHEGFHQFAHARIGSNLPIWVNEGLAEYYGHALMIRGRLETGIAPAAKLESLRNAIREQRTLPFDVIVRMSNRQWADIVQRGGQGSSLMYAQAWSMCHFLIHSDGGRLARALETYVRAAAGGKNADQSLEEAFGTTDLRHFERAWEAHILQMQPDPISTAVERLDFLAEGLTHLHEQGIDVASIADLRRELRARRFRLTVYEHGVERVFSSSDDLLFQPPPSGTRRSTAISLKPSRFSSHPSRRDLPPMIDVTGLGPHLRLQWLRDEDGALVGEVSIK